MSFGLLAAGPTVEPMKAPRRVFLGAAAASIVPLAPAMPAAAANPEPLDSEKFRKAAAAGDTATVTALLDRDPALMWSRDEHGVSVYTAACLQRQKPVADLLASRGLTMDIFEAAAGGNLPRAQELAKID